MKRKRTKWDYLAELTIMGAFALAIGLFVQYSVSLSKKNEQCQKSQVSNP